jgi:hypothetical protein
MEFLCLEINFSDFRIIRSEKNVIQGAEASQVLYNEKENEEHKVVKTVDLHDLYIASRDEGKLKVEGGALQSMQLFYAKSLKLWVRCFVTATGWK